MLSVFLAFSFTFNFPVFQKSGCNAFDIIVCKAIYHIYLLKVTEYHLTFSLLVCVCAFVHGVNGVLHKYVM